MLHERRVLLCTFYKYTYTYIYEEKTAGGDFYRLYYYSSHIKFIVPTGLLQRLPAHHVYTYLTDIKYT